MNRAALLIAVFAVVLVPAGLFAQGAADVIVGDLHQLQTWGNDGGIHAYSVGTTSCNIGSVDLSWVQATPFHPVIGQEMYRLKNGVLEQVGMSWLKHGFCALQNPGLCTGCAGGGGCLQFLTPGCADPYSAGLNGTQSNLGPRSEVNADTGVFPYPFAAPPFSSVIDRRLQVHEVDIDPALNAGALYFVTGQYVTQDDALAENGDNNASYRQIDVATGANFPISFTAGQTTQQMAPGIQAWQDHVPSVDLQDVDVPNEGMFIVGHNVTDNGNGTWHYEYAVYNMNSDRSGGSFTVFFPGAINMTNIGFHDVDHHSGEPFSLTDWPGTYTPGVGVTWTTTPFTSNPNANAIRWATMYNFRFDADAPPAPGLATLGLFKPGAPSTLNVNLQVPNGSTVPGVSNVTCIPGAGQVDIAWTNGDVYDNVEVHRDGVLVETLPGTDTSYAELAVPVGFHTWDVRGVQGAEASFPVLCDAEVTLREVRVEDDTAFAGQVGLDVPILSSHSTPLEGFSLSIQFPSDRLTLVDWTLAGTATEVAGAEFSELNTGSSFLTAEVILDFVGPFVGQMIPVGNNVEIATATFNVSTTVVDGETREISFLDGLGAAVDNTFLIAGLDQPPLTGDGTITFNTQPTFTRGNCDNSSLSTPNIGDAIFGLSYMFSGGIEPACFKACDANDDSALNITDPIFLLTYLFVAASPPPPAPFPTAGPDPTPDALTCN